MAVILMFFWSWKRNEEREEVRGRGEEGGGGGEDQQLWRHCAYRCVDLTSDSPRRGPEGMQVGSGPKDRPMWRGRVT